MRRKSMRLVSLVMAAVVSLSTYVYAASLDDIFEGKQPSLQLVNEKLAPLIEYTSVKFADVSQDAWYINSVAKLTGLNGIEGYPDGTFCPDGTITTAEFTKLLLAGMGYKQKVSSEDEWYQLYVDKAKELGVITGTENYNYNGGMERINMAKMICRILKIDPKKSTKSIFMDTGNVDTAWIDVAFEEFLIRGYYSQGLRTFKPDQTATRAEVSEMVMRALEYRNNPQQYKVEMETYYKELEQKQDQADAVEQGIKDGTLQRINGFVTKVLLKNTGVDVSFDEVLVTHFPGQYPILSITLYFNIADKFPMESQYKDVEEILLQKFDSQFVGKVMEYVKSAKFREPLKFQEFHHEAGIGYLVGVSASYGGTISVDIYEEVK